MKPATRSLVGPMTILTFLAACATTKTSVPAIHHDVPSPTTDDQPSAQSTVLQRATGINSAESPPSWPLWDNYVARFMSADGRIVSPTEHDRTTSEAQSYALFFALVNDEPARFARLLKWTEANLARGDLSKHLPAWLWGRNGRGRWCVLDANSAADADLWIAYDLLEAGRLWAQPRYTRLGEEMLGIIRREEVVTIPGLGPMLLPAPRGFVIDKGKAWRLNPSYLPPELLRRFASADPTGPWEAVLNSSVSMLKASSSHGLVPDWVLYRAGNGFEPDPAKGPVGSYDAIRVYLWVGLLPTGDPLSNELARVMGGLLRHQATWGEVPERVDVINDEVEGRAPPGFLAALLPLAQLRHDGVGHQLEHALADTLANGLYGQTPAYYDQNLILFAQGFLEGRFRFALDGSLVPRWGKPCSGPSRPP